MGGQAWANVVAVTGSLLALVGVALGGGLAARAQRRHWRFAEQADACSEFLAAYAQVYLEHVEAVRTGEAQKATHTSSFVDWRRFHEAVENLNLRVDARIAQAAHDLDRALWELGPHIVGRSVTMAQWADRRRPLDEAKLRFVNVCRSRMGREVPLAALSGRPPDDDPMWAGAGRAGGVSPRP